MKFLSFIRNNVHLWKHLAIAILISIMLAWLVIFSLKIFTHHGRTQLVPDFTGLTIEEAIQVAERSDLEIQLSDSVFVNGRQRGTIVSHVPRSNDRVKKGRRIFITINAFTIPRISMPKVTGVSYRQAKVTLETSGLKVGQLIYRPDPMQNYVLSQRFENKDIEPGTLITRGSTIDLVLGKGISRQTTLVTDVIGLSAEEASEILNSDYINIGALAYDSTVRTYADTLNARVYRQRPNGGGSIRLGGLVDLWLSTNPEYYIMEE